ncbi:MAG: BCCT family transporter, partial [Planctomycetota bacterium]
LSNINTVFLIGLLVFVLAFGPTLHVLLDGARSFVNFAAGFVQRNLWTATTNDPWSNKWTIFYWANWFAWTPISVVFLARISYGYSVRSFIVFNLVLPAAFTSFWMVAFGSAAIHMELSQNAHLIDVLKEGGPEAVLYAFLSHFPMAWLLIPAFLAAAFLSFVTAADSNTSAMSGLSSTGISPESPEPGMFIKIVWGVMIGLIAWVMICFAHLDGIRMLSNLGGLPALLLCLAVTVCLIKVALDPKRYDTFKNGYDDEGRPIAADAARSSQTGL